MYKNKKRRGLTGDAENSRGVDYDCDYNDDTVGHGARRASVNTLTLRSLTLYIYGAPILDVSRSHTTTQHSR